MPAQQTIGDRIRNVRTLRGRSLRAAAGLAGIDHSPWSRIERGERSADNRHMLADIARALQCSVAELTGQPAVPTDRDAGRVAASVYGTVQALLDTDLDLPGTVTDLRPLAALISEADAVQDLGLSCRYAEAAARLPLLLREAHAHLRTATSDDDREVALRTLSAGARWAMVTLKCLGHSTEAWVAADRSWDAARALGDPVTIGVASWSRGHAATSCGAYTRGVAVATAGIEALRDCTAPQAVQVRGSLHLLAGWAQWGLGHTDEGNRLIGEAARLAAGVGDQAPGDDPYGLVFGPTNVGLWQLSAAVEAGDPGKAVEISGSLQPGTLPPSRQAALYLDLGRALADVGETGRAVRAILTAERLGPQRVHRSPLARETVRGLVRHTRRDDTTGLLGLAERLNLNGG